jgi:hypothetical protein
MEQPFSEDVASLVMTHKLDLVYGHEVDFSLDGHRFDRADPVARKARDQLFLAGDQGDGVASQSIGEPIVHLSRQEPERETDHPALVLSHAGQGSKGLSRVRRT